MTRYPCVFPFSVLLAICMAAAPASGEPARTKPRVLVTSDIGGTDPDDFQSMVHLLLHADVLDIEGLVSSPYGPGRKKHILDIIDLYQHDFPNLKARSDSYPEPGFLRSITMQGAVESAGDAGYAKPTEGSEWIIRCARRDDSRPLRVLVWGGIEDLAQALHDAPDILPRLRVHFIGGPNKTWSVNAFDYVERSHPDLWMIEADSTYRGWFTGGDQQGEWGNKAFVKQHVAGHGALGDYFATLLDGTIKMGDSPSVARLLHGNPDDPAQPGWGGGYVRVWDDRKTVFNRLTTPDDKVEAFGTVEITLPMPAEMKPGQKADMILDKRIVMAGAIDGKNLRFRFSPRDAKVWNYVIHSEVPGLDGLTGSFTATAPPVERTRVPSAIHRNWWIDDPDPAVAEGIHAGAKTVSRWRVDYLKDFAACMDRCVPMR